VTRRRPTAVLVVDVADRAVLRHAGVSHASDELAEQATASDSINKPPTPEDPVLAFNSVDERFIDFLVEEALNEWRAKNF
jgi:hypothetical protein